MTVDSAPAYVRRFEPVYPCRRQETRHCPPGYGAVCGDRPCARFESDDETPWLPQGDHDACAEMLRQRATATGIETTVSTEPRLAPGPYSAAFTCPHGERFWVEATQDQIARWVQGVE